MFIVTKIDLKILYRKKMKICNPDIDLDSCKIHIAHITYSFFEFIKKNLIKINM